MLIAMISDDFSHLLGGLSVGLSALMMDDTVALVTDGTEVALVEGNPHGGVVVVTQREGVHVVDMCCRGVASEGKAYLTQRMVRDVLILHPLPPFLRVDLLPEGETVTLQGAPCLLGYGLKEGAVNRRHRLLQPTLLLHDIPY